MFIAFVVLVALVLSSLIVITELCLIEALDPDFPRDLLEFLFSVNGLWFLLSANSCKN